MPLEDAIRRNRRRIAVVTIAAVVNYSLLISLIVGYFFWGFAFEVKKDLDVAGEVVLGTSTLAGTLLAASIIGSRVRGVRPRTMHQLGAVEIRPGELPRVENLLAGLAIAAGTPPVRAALLHDEAPNALAVGRHPKDTAIVITSGLVERLTRDELEAVLAAEMCAIRRLDTAMQSVTMACASSATAVHASLREDWKDPRGWIYIAATWPSMAVAEALRRYALRNCDFGADEMAVTLTRNPEALRRALERLRDDKHVVRALTSPTRPLWFEPLPSVDNLPREFRRVQFTPALDERIARLPHVTPRDASPASPPPPGADP